jgi:hypothetical protein
MPEAYQPNGAEAANGLYKHVAEARGSFGALIDGICINASETLTIAARRT